MGEARAFPKAESPRRSAAEEATLVDLVAEELRDALNAVVEFENQLALDAAANDFNVATADTFAYQDLVEMRKLVRGPTD